MDLRQGKALINKMRIGKIGKQLLDCGLSVLAMRALKIGELYDLQILAGRAFTWPIRALLQLSPVLGVGMIAEGQNFAARDDVLAIGQRKELERAGLLAALFAHSDDHAADAGHRGFQNALNLVDTVGVVAP